MRSTGGSLVVRLARGAEALTARLDFRATRSPGLRETPAKVDDAAGGVGTRSRGLSKKAW
jgi:hypothetical protein